jgi:hypothetical protein
MSDTPETNSVLKEIKQHKIAFYTQECNFEGGKVSFESPIVSLCRKLERERDESRAALKHIAEYGTEEINAAVVLRHKLATALVERDEARGQNAKLRDVAERAINDFNGCKARQLRAELDQLKEEAK